MSQEEISIINNDAPCTGASKYIKQNPTVKRRNKWSYHSSWDFNIPLSTVGRLSRQKFKASRPLPPVDRCLIFRPTAGSRVRVLPWHPWDVF